MIWVGLQLGSFPIGFLACSFRCRSAATSNASSAFRGFLAFFDNAKLLLMSLSARHDIFPFPSRRMPCNSANLPAADRCGRLGFSNLVAEPAGVLIVPLELEEWCFSFCGALSDSHAAGTFGFCHRACHSFADRTLICGYLQPASFSFAPGTSLRAGGFLIGRQPATKQEKSHAKP